MKNTLETFWQKFVCLAESWGRARAATSLARQGYTDLARRIMLDNDKCC